MYEQLNYLFKKDRYFPTAVDLAREAETMIKNYNLAFSTHMSQIKCFDKYKRTSRAKNEKQDSAPLMEAEESSLMDLSENKNVDFEEMATRALLHKAYPRDPVDVPITLCGGAPEGWPVNDDSWILVQELGDQANLRRIQALRNSEKFAQANTVRALQYVQTLPSAEVFVNWPIRLGAGRTRVGVLIDGARRSEREGI